MGRKTEKPSKTYMGSIILGWNINFIYLFYSEVSSNTIDEKVKGAVI